jgi:hypothetical protein
MGKTQLSSPCARALTVDWSIFPGIDVLLTSPRIISGRVSLYLPLTDHSVKQYTKQLRLMLDAQRLGWYYAVDPPFSPRRLHTYQLIGALQYILPRLPAFESVVVSHSVHPTISVTTNSFGTFDLIVVLFCWFYLSYSAAYQLVRSLEADILRYDITVDR